MNVEGWSIIDRDAKLIDIPTCAPFLVRGRVFGHDEVPDNEFAYIKLIGYSFQDDAFHDESGMEWRLKEPDPTYSALVKNAKKRLETMIRACRFLIPSLRMRAA